VSVDVQVKHVSVDVQVKHVSVDVQVKHCNTAPQQFAGDAIETKVLWWP